MATREQVQATLDRMLEDSFERITTCEYHSGRLAEVEIIIRVIRAKEKINGLEDLG